MTFATLDSSAVKVRIIQELSPKAAGRGLNKGICVKGLQQCLAQNALWVFVAVLVGLRFPTGV